MRKKRKEKDSGKGGERGDKEWKEEGGRRKTGERTMRRELYYIKRNTYHKATGHEEKDM